LRECGKEGEEGKRNEIEKKKKKKKQQQPPIINVQRVSKPNLNNKNICSSQIFKISALLIGQSQ
jgi:hypothetical protein